MHIWQASQDPALGFGLHLPSSFVSVWLPNTSPSTEIPLASLSAVKKRRESGVHWGFGALFGCMADTDVTKGNMSTNTFRVGNPWS